MKKRKILYLFPIAALILSGCTLQEGYETAKNWLGENIYFPVRDWIESLINPNGKKDQPADEGGDEEDPTPAEIQTYSVEEAIAKCDAAGSGVVVKELLRVQGVVAFGATKESHSWTGSFESSGEKTLTFDSVKEDGEEYSSIDGATVVIEGYLELFNGKYKLGYLPKDASPTGAKYNPKLISVVQPEKKEVKSLVSVTGPKSVYKNTTVSVNDITVNVIYSDDQEGQVHPDRIELITAVVNPAAVLTAYVGDLSISYNVKVFEMVHGGTSVADAFTVDEAIHYIDLGVDLTDKYVKGYVSAVVDAYNTQFKNVTLDISEDGSTELNQFRCYRSKGSTEYPIDENTAFDGKFIVVNGTMKKFYETYEMDAGNTFAYIGDAPAAVESVQLSASELVMEVGQQQPLSASVLPAACDQAVEWEVSQTNEVVSFEDGYVHALAEGSATITATSVEDPSVSASCTVTVNAATKQIVDIAVDVTAVKTQYEEGQAYSADGIVVSAIYEDQSHDDITAASTIVVSKETAEAGDKSFDITVTYGSFEKVETISVTVEEKPQPVHAGTADDPYTPSDVLLAYASLQSGETAAEQVYVAGTIAADPAPVINDSRGRFYVTDGEKSFYVYNINNVDNQKNLTLDDIPAGSEVVVTGAVKNYNGTLQLVYNGSTDPKINCYIYSIEKPVVAVTGISLDKDELVINVGMPDQTLVATIAPENATNKAVEWESANPEVATVNDGVVHAVAVGETTVTVTSVADPTKSATCSVTVNEQTKELVSVQIKTMPKVAYTEGDKLDLSDLVLTLYYDDQSTEDVTTGYTTNIALDHELTTEDTELIITYGEFGLQPITLTITAKPQPTHAGTAEDPYTGEDAVIVANNLAAGGVTEDSYYVKGVVASFEENFNPSFGNYSFKIEGGFIGWRLLNGESKAKFNAGDLEIGDTVTMYVQIQSYIKNAGDTPKPESKNGYIVSIERPFVAPETIEITSGSEVAVGGTLTLAATVGPVGASQDVDWDIVSGGDYATLSDGVLTGVAAGDVVVKATATGYESVTTQKTISVTADTPVTISDELTRATTGVTGTSYTEWSGKSVNSTAVYAGQSAGGYESIQLRSKNSNSGIVTTASGGTLKKIIVVWNSNTQDNNKIDIYGDTSAYSSPTQLYGTPKGTKLGSIEKGVSTELEISGEYTFVGIRSNNNAVYLTSITFVWG